MLKGTKMTKESRNKISKAGIGRVHSKETKIKISKKLKGKRQYKITDEIRKKMSIAKLKNPTNFWLNKKRPQISEITRQKLSGENSGAWKGGVSKCINYSSIIARRRQIRKLGNGGSHTLQEWENLKKKYNFMCLCCKQQEPFIKLTEDHIVPLSKKGSDNISNIQPLCQSCNSIKYTKIISYIDLIKQ